MGMKSIVDQVENLFSKKSNFDESGFLISDLITPELVNGLAHLDEKDRKNLKKLGYEFKWFNQEMTDGLIFRWVIERSRKIFYTQRLYFKEDKNGSI